jgi:tetratricopeptide (TPR) repeat protein
MIKVSSICALFGVFVFSACAAHPPAPAPLAQRAPTAEESERDSLDKDPAERAAVEKGAAKTAPLPPNDLSAKIFYQLLLAEIAGQRDRMGLAVTTYLDVAKATRDPRIAQRATEVALYARQAKPALEAAVLWAELDPESTQARQTITALLVSEGKLDEARPYLERFLAASGGQGFLHLNALVAKHPDKASLKTLILELTKPYPSLPEARYSNALAAFNAKDQELALSEIRSASELRPGWEAAALLEAQIVHASGKEPDSFYKQFLQRYSQAREVRLAYARYLVDLKNFPAAREQFKEILHNAPDNADLTLAVGLLSLQLEDFDAAETYLKRVLELNFKDPDAVRFYLGQLNEDRKRYAQAAEWYGLIGPGENFLPAQIKIAAMLARQNRLDDARKHLQGVTAENSQQRVQLILADAQLLREAKAYQVAFDTLTQALETMPNYPDLLYDRAMVSEKLERLDILEQDLRKVIALKPDHAHAYNALGYTLADRTQRYPEALELIQKAIALAPGDPFIKDSLGWVQYRMGNLSEAETTLREAYKKQPDPEIAAHLGEVLWMAGNKDEAQKIWSAKSKEHPNNDVLNTVIKKFVP